MSIQKPTLHKLINRKRNVAPITLRFKDVAKAVIKNLKIEMPSGNEKATTKP
jgi:hypothetical protein